MFEKVNFDLKSADDNKGLENIQRAKSYSHVGLLKLFTVLYLLHKHMSNLNKCIQLCTKSRIKTKKLAN